MPKGQLDVTKRVTRSCSKMENFPIMASRNTRKALQPTPLTRQHNEQKNAGMKY